MSNSEMDSASPFAGILIGQPTLNRQLRMGAFAATDQRIATRFTIKFRSASSRPGSQRGSQQPPARGDIKRP